MRIVFASHNRDKFREVSAILRARGIDVEFADMNIAEIQANNLEEIATNKAIAAYEGARLPVLVEDDGLYVQRLGGFPGQYSSFVFGTIGVDGILKLLDGERNRSAKFVSVLCFHDGSKTALFNGTTHGSISTNKVGSGWGYDPIFIPDGAGGLTYAQLTDKKATVSHRGKALEAFTLWVTGG